MSTPRNLSDRYELGETLGFGGMSEVHAGRDLRLDRDVAVKVLRADLARDPSFYLRFRREAQNAAALNHPAIVAVYDTGEADTPDGVLPYIVMEQVDGETLRDIVRNDGPLTPRRAMEVMGDVCAALDFSHRHGIVHRDVKPANIMINRAGAVKVMDFGIARAIADGTSTMTQTAAVIGTAQYLSPEQARGEQVDARSDVYAAGCVLYELLTGEPPFTGDSPVAVAYQHVREDPRPPSTVNAAVPATVDSIVLKAMSKNPANRYQSAGEMRTDLLRVLGGQRPGAPAVMTDDDRTEFLGVAPLTVGRRHDDPLPGDDLADEPARGRRTALVVLAGVVVVALIGLIGFFLYDLNGGGRPTQVAIADVAGQSSEEAQNVLRAQGLDTRVSQVADATVAEGAAVRTDPVADSTVDEGSPVTLFVSTGPQQVPVPMLVNLTQDAAVAALTELGLQGTPADAQQPSDTVPAGSVLSSDPPAGDTVDAGGTVTLVISSGVQQIQVPSVMGLSQADAEANLKAAGFTPVPAPADSSEPKGQVLSQSPEGSTMAAKGASITINVSSGNRIRMPDLVGKEASEALALLTEAGYTGGQGNIATQARTVTDPAQNGRVVAQSVGPNTDIEPSRPLTLAFGALATTSTTASSTPTTTPPPTPTG